MSEREENTSALSGLLSTIHGLKKFHQPATSHAVGGGLSVSTSDLNMSCSECIMAGRHPSACWLERRSRADWIGNNISINNISVSIFDHKVVNPSCLACLDRSIGRWKICLRQAASDFHCLCSDGPACTRQVASSSNQTYSHPVSRTCRVWTCDRLARRNWPHNPLYVLCRQTIETVHHLLAEY